MFAVGYRRPDGRYGLRNYLLVLPASVCATDTAARIAARLTGAVHVPNQHGCSQLGRDLAITRRTLIGCGLNPNVGAVLVVGLGCEGVQTSELVKAIAESGKPVKGLVIQENGGTLKSVAAGLLLASDLARTLASQKKEEFPISELVLGLECGGSDPTSGLASNPAIGYVSDKLVSLGGSSILSETTEVIGAEHLLANRFKDLAQKQKFLALVEAVEKRAVALGVDLREGQPTPGNKAGGISTIEEKSLGCMFKAGLSPFQGALDYGELIPHSPKGLYFMDSPGQDIESITGMAASGAQIVVFSTGRGSPTGFPFVPVIKLTGNADTFAMMSDNIDFDASPIVQGTQSLAETGEKLFSLVLETARGCLSKAEILGHCEFGIYKAAGAF